MPKGKTLSIVFVAAAVLLIDPAVRFLSAGADGGSGSGAVLIKNVRVFDGERILEKGSVLLRDGTIVSVGRDPAVPPEAEVVDGTGKTLLPGLIDAHVHVYGKALEQALVFGVTTEIDMFTVLSVLREARDRQAAGKSLDRADIVSAGTLVTAPGGHGSEYGVPIPTIRNADEAQAFVDARIAEGSDFIKIIYGPPPPAIDRATLAAVIAAAHARGKLAVVHALSYASALEAVKAGADVLAHVFADKVPEKEFIDLAVKNRVVLIPTLTVIGSLAGHPLKEGFLKDPGLAPFLAPADLGQFKLTFPAGYSLQADYDTAAKAVRVLSSAGIPILAGTDAPNPGTVHGASLHLELERLVAAGLAPARALAAATALPAAVFGLKGRGRIAPGLRADLVLVAGNPLDDIRATRAIEGIWKAGVRFDRGPYRNEVERLKAEEAKLKKAAPPPGSESGLISDFEDGTAGSRFGLGWAVSTDAYAGGKSKAALKVVEDGADGSRRSLSVSGEVAPGLSYAWSGAIFFPSSVPFAPANLSHKTELVFRAKGDVKTLQVMVNLKDRGFIPLTVPVRIGADWGELAIPFKAFGNSDGSSITAITIAAGPEPGPFAFQIDEVRLR